MDFHGAGFLIGSARRPCRRNGWLGCALDERVEKDVWPCRLKDRNLIGRGYPWGTTEAGFLDNRREVQKHGTAESGHHARGAFVHGVSVSFPK